MDIIQLSDDGQILSTNRDTIFNDLLTQFKAVYGSNTYIEKGTEDYNMLSLLADLMSDMGNVAVSAGNALSLTNATGNQLDNLASVYYGTFARKAATKSTVIVVITGTPNVTIANGQVRDNLGGIWNLPASVTIPSAGTTNVIATYSEYGAYYISANQISGASCIATPVAGWTNVSQPSECTIGQDVETDASFRARIAQRSKGTAIGTLNSLKTNLLAMTYVNPTTQQTETPIQEVRIHENDTSTDSSSIVSGLTIHGHSIAIVVYTGGSITVDSDLSKAIANAIYNYKSTGVGTDGTISQVITNTQGQNITVKYSDSTGQSIGFAIVLKKLISTAPDLTDDAISEIRSQVTTKLGTYQIGDTIYAQDFYYTVTTAMSKVLDTTQYNISSITLSSGSSTGQTSIALPYNKKGIVAQESDISVTTTTT